MLIRGGKILVNQAWQCQHEVYIQKNKICELRAASAETADIILNSEDYLVPAFTDLHIHGARGCDVMDANSEALQTIAATLLEEGVTGFLATTMAEPLDKIEAALQACYEFRAHQTSGAALLGVHLEGPFLSHVYRGAQSGEYLEQPNIGLLKKWQQQFPGLIKLITIAPELPGALDFIEYATQEGIVISVGHTDASFAETERGINAGASYATHLFNAMSGVHHRHPGAAAALLMDDRIIAELIADGTHIVPEMLRFVVKLKGLQHLVLVTDAMRAKCLKAGVYDLGGQEVAVDNEGVARLVSNHKLAGSTLRLNQALRNLQKFTQLDLLEILPLVIEQPLQVLKIKDSGSIAPGQIANLVILTRDLNVKGVIAHGQLVYQR